MNKIVKSAQLSEKEFDFWVEAPRIARKALPGQFLILRINEYGERIPLTIVDTDVENGLVRIIAQVIGKTTAELAQLEAGDMLLDVTGPLGMPTEVENYGTVVLVGGGVGIAALFPIIKGLKLAGNKVITILGAKTKELVILQEECQNYSDEVIITTDDGSLGEKGLVTDAMKRVFERETVNFCWSIGPSVMMKFCALTCMDFDVPVFVSLNPIMIDGTGMCGCCRITVGNSIKFACVDGPEFRGEEVNWEEFINRMRQYKPEELVAMGDYENEGVTGCGTKK